MVQTQKVKESASVYTPFILRLYDWWVLGISNQFAWQCPTRTVLLPFFGEHLRTRHMDVGVGTGFYPAHTNLDKCKEITLVDLNPNSLKAAHERIGRANVKTIEHDIFLPLPEIGVFDSISLFYLLHCLPGNFIEKENVIKNLKPCLAKDGILYGATILGDEAGHNRFGGKLMQLYNRKGIFGNKGDTQQQLQQVLERHFQHVTVARYGKVALFTAQGVI